MRKHAIILFLAAMLVALPACAGDYASHDRSEPPEPTATIELSTPEPTATIKPSTPEPTATIESSTPEKLESDNPFLQADFLTDVVLSGSGRYLGTYGYIEVRKADLPEFHTEEFSTYFTEFANKRVRDSGYNWVSIIFEDATGFCFTGSNTIIADYGYIDNEGCIIVQLGTCMISSLNRFEYEGPFEHEKARTRSIPNPTLKQVGLVPDNSFEPIDEIIFSVPASENGLEDTAFYVEGKVVSCFEMSGYKTIQFSTDYGDIYISEVFPPMSISEGDTATVYFVYTGMSVKYNCPCGAYVHHE